MHIDSSEPRAILDKIHKFKVAEVGDRLALLLEQCGLDTAQRGVAIAVKPHDLVAVLEPDDEKDV